MSIEDFSQNLRLLCNYTTSISDTTRRIGINRQQFYRYLNGSSFPSKRTLQKICDFFGVEDFEIISDHKEFRDLLAVRKPKIADIDPLGEYIARLNQINPDSTKNLRPYLGYYHAYYMSAEFPHKVTRSLVKVFEKNGFVYTKSIENLSEIKGRKRRTQKYSGIMYSTGDKLIVFERENAVGKMMWNAIFHAVDEDQSYELSGLTMGITGNIVRDIGCCRIVWERISSQCSIRTALQNCGVFARDDARMPANIIAAIDNAQDENSVCFLSRH